MSVNIIGDFLIENSRSRSSKHVSSSILLVYKKGKGLVKPSGDIVVEEKEGSPTYAKGRAKLIKVKLDHGDFAIYGWFVKNYLNRVKGYVEVFNHKGVLVFKARYSNGVLTRIAGDSVYAWLVRVFAEAVRLDVYKTRLGDEK
ncbi:MAG: hypothetical protein ACO2OS_00740 [Thermosphaera aggregans]|uniref:hypothetical protein n=1 Tax=Thermosphaera aggregans TaxID=54254 RepID=UPI003C0E9256